MAQQNPPAMQETQKIWVLSLGWEDPLEKGMATHASILTGKSHGQRSLVGHSPWCHKESDMIKRWCTHTRIMECLAVCSGGQIRIWGGGFSRGSRRAGTRVSHPCGWRPWGNHCSCLMRRKDTFADRGALRVKH